MPEDEELKKELEAPKVSYSKMEINLSSARRVLSSSSSSTSWLTGTSFVEICI